MFYIRKTILNGANYQLDRCFPEIHDASYRDKFTNLSYPDRFTRLPPDILWWLINIQSAYMVFHQGNFYTVEPYMPCRFARQFTYNQLYVGNPNLNFRLCENLFEGARALYYSIAGGIGPIFTLSHKTPNSYIILGFCAWYFIANKVPGFRINTSFIRGIRFAYKANEGSKGYRI